MQTVGKQDQIQRKSQNTGKQSPSQFHIPSNLDILQRATEIKYGGLTDFNYEYGPQNTLVTGQVGTRMEAHLDPRDPKTGTDTSGSDAFDNLFTQLQAPANNDSTWVRGHLLNHDLGGIAHYNNLFPITTAANGEHYHEVEKQIKHWVANNNEVDYNVRANKLGGNDTPDGEFVCNARVTNNLADNDAFDNARISKTIKSRSVKTPGVRHYAAKTANTNKFSEVEIHDQNNVARDTYRGLKKDARWDHDVGTALRNRIEVPNNFAPNAVPVVVPQVDGGAVEPELADDREVTVDSHDLDAFLESFLDRENISSDHSYKDVIDSMGWLWGQVKSEYKFNAHLICFTVTRYPKSEWIFVYSDIMDSIE